VTAVDVRPLLDRGALPHPAPAPPVRIVHLGLGAFHRSHQAWYTAHAADSAHWGIEAFTGRRPDAAEALQRQEGVYTLVERGPAADRFEVVGSIVSARSGGDVTAFLAAMRSPHVAVVTLTITEAGYRLDGHGRLDLDDPGTAADIRLLRRSLGGQRAREAPVTALGRLILGLEARRAAGAPPVAIVPCDNLPENGPLLRRALVSLAEEVDPEFAGWLAHGATFVSTSVDRITPRLEEEDRAVVAAATGRSDAVPVVTEPFSDWVLAGEFPSGRPQWETAGARFIDDIAPWEARKLWMLNGAHTLLAAVGPRHGHSTVADAFADPRCRVLVELLWDAAAASLPDVETATYRHALAERFANPRIEHRLTQIAEGARTKVRLRIVPIALAERAAGRSAAGIAQALAAWIAAEAPGQDPRAVLAEFSPELAQDEVFVAALRSSFVR
jgi:fructuronate reductase